MPSLRNAINQAISICWNETIGWKNGGMAYSSSDGVDCSGLVGRVLSDNGFNYPSQHIGTYYMKPYLRNAGFNIIPVTNYHPILQAGDIIVMNHPLGQGGHTFFYMENIQGYTDPSADTDTIGNVSQCKVESSSDRGHSADGDHRKNGTGAYWEVWVHAYSSLFGNYDPTDPNDEIYIARYRGGLNGLDFRKKVLVTLLK